MSIRTLSTREVYRNQWMRLREDRIERLAPGRPGVEGLYSVVDKDDCAAIIAIDRSNDRADNGDPQSDFIYLVEQFRYTIQQTCLELPQGGWEQANVDPEELARGELLEETGVTAETMTCLGMIHVAYGFASQRQFVYLAEGLTPGAPTGRDAEEHDLKVHRIPVTEFEAMLRDGRIQDACTLAAWALYNLHR